MTAPPRETWVPFAEEDCIAFAPRTIPPPRIEGVVYDDDELGEGAFGVVYLGTQSAMSRRVAVKVVDGTGPNEGETRAQGSVQHPNIVTIHATGMAEDGRRYLILEFMAGGTLEGRR